MGFGLVKGEDGQKMKSRSGDTIKLRELLDEAKERSLAGYKEKMEEHKGEGEEVKIDPATLDNTAEVIGITSIKYFDLRQNRVSGYKFSFDSVLDPKGNTGVYLLYMYVRICSILAKGGVSVMCNGSMMKKL